ncbi:hypothetical protein [Bradyrhizobium sp. CSS354]|uniref:hypothetical protein n=1 Tax=Bradyrhizobium sp. CSS354 TaxID=2699172 RepID=UPI0023B11402|nr:hypothetical protein [Bradyrhizobium sp. CSS354]MDE5465426.1 hypothetical protein [Bradyrhizobium sp. CSS354]
MNAALGSLLQRKEAELRWKLTSLPEELNEWRQRAAIEHSLQKNHSQISLLSLRIERLHAVVKAEFNQAVGRGELWLRATSLEKKTLIVHSVWDQFRSRLSLRLVSPFDTYLALADAYARECYEPAYRQLRNIAPDQLCPAPLVTFDQQVSPWMKPDGDTPQPDQEVTGLLTATQFQDALDQLPLTLVGVPWSYLTYLPHMALLAHELGHALERGAGLTARLDQAIEDAACETEQRRAGWKAWRKEVFADWYGCAMGGPAFVWSLAEYLASDQGQIRRQTRPHENGSWTPYPTATVRVLFCCHSLRVMGFETDASSISACWSQAYPENPLEEFSRDFEAVVNSFCEVFDPRQPQFKAFRRPMRDVAIIMANVYRQGGGLPAHEPKPARTYVAAARLLLQKPPPNASLPSVWQKLRDHHVTTRPGGVAGATPALPDMDDAQDSAAVDRLAAILFADI